MQHDLIKQIWVTETWGTYLKLEKIVRISFIGVTLSTKYVNSYNMYKNILMQTGDTEKIAFSAASK